MKKYIALLLTLIITASTLAACAAGVPSSSSSHVPVSSSVASAPSSSVAVSSLPQLSSAIASTSLSIPELFAYTLISQNEETSTFQYNVEASFGQYGIYSFSITLPSNWYFGEENTRNVYDDLQKLKTLVVSAAGRFMSADDLENISIQSGSNEYHTLLDKGSYTSSSGKSVSFFYVESTYNMLVYVYDYSIMIEEDKGLRLIFYRETYNPDIDISIQRAIIDSIETIAIY